MKKYAILQQIDLEHLYNTYLGLPPRQQRLALGGAVGVIFLLLILPLSLASGRLGALHEEIAETRATMGAIARQIEQFSAVRGRHEALENLLKSGFDEKILVTVDGIAAQTEMRELVDPKEKPRTTTKLFDEYVVEVKVNRVTLQQLVDFLHKIENVSGKVLRIKRLMIERRHDNPHILNAAFDVVSYKLAAEK